MQNQSMQIESTESCILSPGASLLSRKSQLLSNSKRIYCAFASPSGSKIYLRRAIGSDESLLLHWANDLQVRSNSFSSGLITPRVHSQWFQDSLKNPNRLILIAIGVSGYPLGQIRFDRSFTSNEAYIDISLDTAARGFGLASALVHQGIQFMQKYWGKNILLSAEVFEKNTASNLTFTRYGFTPSASVQLQSVIHWSWHQEMLNLAS